MSASTPALWGSPSATPYRYSVDLINLDSMIHLQTYRTPTHARTGDTSPELDGPSNQRTRNQHRRRGKDERVLRDSNRGVSVCLSVCLSVHLSVNLCVHLFICLSACLSACLPSCLSLSVCLSVCLSLCLSVCLSVYLLSPLSLLLPHRPQPSLMLVVLLTTGPLTVTSSSTATPPATERAWTWCSRTSPSTSRVGSR